MESLRGIPAIQVIYVRSHIFSTLARPFTVKECEEILAIIGPMPANELSVPLVRVLFVFCQLSKSQNGGPGLRVGFARPVVQW